MGEAKTITVVGLGEILWDMLPDGKQLGGAPANFAYHANALGAQGVVVSAIGRDQLGRDIYKRLGELGLSRSYIAIDPEHPTGTVDVKLDEKGVPQYTIRENVAWDFISSSPELLELAPQVSAVCFGTLCQRSEVSRETIQEFLSQTGPDCLWVFDINLRKPYYDEDVVRASLEAAHVLKLNLDELRIVAEMVGIEGSGEDELIARMLEQFPLRMIALTNGESGSVLATPEETSRHPGFQVEVCDTVGAGDAFTAALTIGLLKGLSLDNINICANRLASYVCTQKGATPAVPDEICRLVK